MSKLSKFIIAIIVIVLIVLGALYINQNINNEENNNLESGAGNSLAEIIEENETNNESNNTSDSKETNNEKIIKNQENNEYTNAKPEKVIYPVNLTTSELKEIEEYLNQKENNGFVSPYNTYTKPSEINLNTIFYDAFALEGGNNSLSEDELNAYKAMGRYGDTDIRKVTTEQAKQRYLEKTGETLTNLSSRLNWIYLEQYDAYYTEGGDTGMVDVKCLSGLKNEDGTYVVKINAGNVNETVILKKNGDNYLFISNVKE